MQYLDCLRNVHASGRDFIDLEISTLLHTLHGLAAAEQLWNISLPLGLFHASATVCWPTTRVSVTCVLCCSPRLSQGQSANLTVWGRNRQHMPVAFLRGWRPWLWHRWVHPAGTLLPLHHRSTAYPGYHSCLPPGLEAPLATTVLCVWTVPAMDNWKSFFFFPQQGVLALKTEFTEKRVCRFCYRSQVFLPSFVI